MKAVVRYAATVSAMLLLAGAPAASAQKPSNSDAQIAHEQERERVMRLLSELRSKHEAGGPVAAVYAMRGFQLIAFRSTGVSVTSLTVTLSCDPCTFGSVGCTASN